MQSEAHEYSHIYKSGFLDTIEPGFELVNQTLLKEHSDNNYAQEFGRPVDIFDTIIISDIHLGSKVSRAEELLCFLDQMSFKRLIINGDVFDSINMRRLNRRHWKVLSTLRKITDRENDTEVIWIRGNHDGYSDLLTQLLGIQVYDEYEMFWNGYNVHVLHGDIFDKFLSKFPLIADIADLFYRFSVLVDPVKMRFSRWLKRNSKTFLRNNEHVQSRAIAYAQRRKADVIICGHTHQTADNSDHGIRYLNSGSWTDSPGHFIGFAHDQIKVLSYSQADK